MNDDLDVIDSSLYMIELKCYSPRVIYIAATTTN